MRFIFLTIIIVLCLILCHITSGKNIKRDIAQKIETEIIEINSIKKNRNKIVATEIEENIFIENLDEEILIEITESIGDLVKEIVEKEKSDPQFVMNGKWNETFRNSEEYYSVVRLGLKAIKPIHYILYKSGSSGLYEYILCSAINDIVKYEFSDNREWQWATAFEFRQLYNEKVKNIIEEFYCIVDDNTVMKESKMQSIKELGIFAIAPLLEELDLDNSCFKDNEIIEIISDIVREYNGEEISDNFIEWRSKNEEIYKSVIEILVVNISYNSQE